MITIVGSLKGGSGKSTLTFNLGVWLSMAGVKVQLIDADPQATLTDVIDVRKEGVERWLYNLAMQQPLAYGVISLIMAMVAGWGASELFRRLRL